MRFTRTLASAMLLLSAAASICPAQSTRPATTTMSTPSAGLDALIKQLADHDWKVRDAAQTLIVHMGNDAAKAMQELAATSTNPEVRQRPQEILQQIAVNDFTKPSLVTLH